MAKEVKAPPVEPMKDTEVLQSATMEEWKFTAEVKIPKVKSKKWYQFWR